MSEHLIRAKAIEDVVIERCRQISAEGYTAEHDDAHARGELARAAASYALAGAAKSAYPQQPEIWRAALDSWPFADAAKHKHEARRLFVIAAAFLIAEVERIDRLAEATGEARAIGEYDAREATGGQAVRDMHIKFRGEDDVFIGYQVDASGPGSGVCVEWWFKDGRPEQNVTPAEEDEICQTVIGHWDDGRYDEP